jgi:cytochrome P450
LLLQAHDKSGLVSDSELVGQTNLLLLASYETTTTALTWTLFLLAQHPRVAQDLHDELKSVLRGDPPTLEQLDKLALLDAVIKESLRILPPVIYNTRTAVKPFALGPHHLDTGATVGFSHYITHHLPELFPDPEKFMPERWLSCDPSPYEYLPFGAGSRTCIGAAFALMLTKIAVAIILQRFSIAVVDDSLIDRKGLITLAPKFGMPMLLDSIPGRFAKSRVRGSIHEMVDLN